MADIQFLIGPMVRRASPEAVYIFLTTPSSLTLRGEVYLVDTTGVARAQERGGRSGPPRSTATNLARSEHTRWGLGPGMTAHLLKLTPASGRGFPTGQILAYDVLIDPGTTSLKTHPERADFVLGKLELPTFILQATGSPLRAVQGSCRKMHGGANDAMTATDRELVLTAAKTNERPSVLFLTGDQIYADDVASPLMKVVLSTASTIRGGVDAVPGLPGLGGVRLSARQRLATDACKFTSGEAGNHLFTFGEYAAMYALAWNPRLWPASMPPVSQSESPTEGQTDFIKEYAKQCTTLNNQRSRVVSARRVLANISSYMMWDDHEITDDWFLNAAWKAAVQAAPAGKRVIANGIGAFAVFQAWGNTPDRFETGDGKKLRLLMEQTLAAGPVTASSSTNFDDLAWTMTSWAFTTPTQPLGYMLNTRTQRASTRPPAAGDAPRLMDDEAWKTMRSECAPATGKPLIVVAPAPIYGFTPVENLLGMAMRLAESLAAAAGSMQIVAQAGRDLADTLVKDGTTFAVQQTAELTRMITVLTDQAISATTDLLQQAQATAQQVASAAQVVAAAAEALAANLSQSLRSAITTAGNSVNPAARLILQELLDLTASGSATLTSILRGISSVARKAAAALAVVGTGLNKVMLAIAARAALVLAETVLDEVVPAIEAVADVLRSLAGAVSGAAAVGSGATSLGSKVDFESWDANLVNFLDFSGAMRAISPSVCVVLSGDVHYASAVSVRLTPTGGAAVPIAQLTSSATNNSPGNLGLVLKALSLDTQLLLSIPATTYLWGGAPPSRADVGSYSDEVARRRRSHDVMEARSFATDLTHAQGPVLTDGNMGLLSVGSGGVVRHSHLVDEKGQTRRVLSLRWEPSRWPI